MEDFKEYTSEDDNYVSPERKEVSEVIPIRLYCSHPGCKKYIKGDEGYNGGFTAETGQYADLRNQSWYCKEHRDAASDKFKQAKELQSPGAGKPSYGHEGLEATNRRFNKNIGK